MTESDEQYPGYSKVLRFVGPKLACSAFNNYQVLDDEHSSRRRQALDLVVKYARNVKDTNGRNLILIGSVGTGKDHLAIATLRAAMSFGMTARYVSGIGLINICRQHFREHSEEVPPDWQSVDLLVISDIEPTPYKISDFEERCLYSLMNYRYMQMLPTVVTTNIPKRSALADLIGERTVDRLFGDAVVVPMIWPSFRHRG